MAGWPGSGGTRIAMWSGPRNISTALLRSWGSRADTVVCDEPLYAHYLEATGAAHPGREEVIAAGETDWRRVVARLAGPVPEGKAIFFQKHMAHHLLPGMAGEWLLRLESFLLIRDPREMLTSLVRVTPAPRLTDTGLPQQRDLVGWLRERTGRTPAVVDAKDLLDAPASVLERLCGALRVPFDRAMLAWEAGPRATDGVWAPHWYAEVVKSTGFRAHAPKPESVPGRLADLYETCLEIYRGLHALRIAA